MVTGVFIPAWNVLLTNVKVAHRHFVMLYHGGADLVGLKRNP